MEMKPQLTEYLMLHGVLKNADAETMAQEILDMIGLAKVKAEAQTSQPLLAKMGDTITRLSEAIDPDHKFGPDTELVVEHARKIRERNHELEQKELLRSASRPAEAKAMKDILEESKRLKAQLESVQKANAELREFALTHFSREQVKPLVEACQAMLDLLDWGTWRNEYTDGRGFLEHLADHILPAVEQALAHARAVGMEDKP